MGGAGESHRLTSSARSAACRVTVRAGAEAGGAFQLLWLYRLEMPEIEFSSTFNANDSSACMKDADGPKPGLVFRRRDGRVSAEGF